MDNLLDKESSVVVLVLGHAHALLATRIVNNLLSRQHVVVIVVVLAFASNNTVYVVITRRQNHTVIAQLLTTFKVEGIGVTVCRPGKVALGYVNAWSVCLGLCKDIDISHIAIVTGCYLVALTCERGEESIGSVGAGRRAASLALMGIGDRSHATCRVETQTATLLLAQHATKVLDKPLPLWPVLTKIVLAKQQRLVHR